MEDVGRFAKEFPALPLGVKLVVSQMGDAVLFVPVRETTTLVDAEGNLRLVFSKAEFLAFAATVAEAKRYCGGA